MRSNKRSYFALAVGAAAGAALLLTSCAGPSDNSETGPGNESKSVTVGLANQVAGKQIDAARTTGGAATQVIYSVFQRMFIFDDHGIPQPNVVTKAVSSNGGETRTLTIKEGLSFHNGEALTASDIKFSLDRTRGAVEELQDPTQASSLESIKSVDVKDDSTVILHLKFDDPVLNNQLAFLAGVIFPEDYIKEVGSDGFASKPIGSGPYEWVSEQAGSTIKLAKFDDYVGPNPAGFDALEIRMLPDPATRVAQLEAGGIDFAMHVDLSQVDRLKAAGFTVQGQAENQYLIMLVNKDSQPLQDVRVRKAINLAINREGIVKNIYKGLADPVTTVFPKLAGAVDGFTYDPKKAQQLLKEAGWKTGTTLTVDYPNGRYPMDSELMQAVQSDLQKVGIDVKLRPMEAGDWIDGLGEKTLDDMTLTLNGNINFDPLQAMTVTYGCDGPYSLWCDPKLDAMYDIVRPLSGDERLAEYKKIDAYMMESVPMIYLVDPQQVNAFDKDIKWAPPMGTGNFSLSTILPAK